MKQKKQNQNPIPEPEDFPLPESQEVTNAKAKEALQKDIANIIKKVEATGNPLTGPQRALLMAYCDEPTGEIPVKGVTYAKKQSELATILGFKDRKTIQRWLKQPGNPGKQDDGRYDVMAWKAYAKANGHKIPGEDDPESHSATRAKAEQVLLQNERLRFRIKQDRGEVLPKTVAKEVFGKLLTSAKARTYSSIVRMVTLARLAPNTALAAEEVKKEVDSIWQSLTDSSWLK